jgi:hypothetical protein
MGLFRQHTPPALPTAEQLEPETAVVPWVPDPILSGVRRLRMYDADGIFSSFSGAVTIAGSGSVSMLSILGNGRGEALVVAGPDPFQNSMIGKDDNLQLLANIAARGTVCFDDYHHEFPERSGRGMLAMIGPAIAQLLFCGLALAISRGRRFGAPRPPTLASGRSVSEYLSELGSLFGRARVERDLTADLTKAFRQRLASRYGISPDVDDAEAARRLAKRAAVSESRVVNLLGRARFAAKGDPTPEEYAGLAREFATVESALFG